MKVITVPLNKRAQEDLDYNNSNTDDLIELAISDEAYFVLEKEVFLDFNKICNVLIDNYEDEKIIGTYNLKRLLEFMESDTITEKAEAIPKYNEIKSMIIEAINRETGIYFFF